jgi:hypothetical protein
MRVDLKLAKLAAFASKFMSAVNTNHNADAFQRLSTWLAAKQSLNKVIFDNHCLFMTRH